MDEGGAIAPSAVLAQNTRLETFWLFVKFEPEGVYYGYTREFDVSSSKHDVSSPCTPEPGK